MGTIREYKRGNGVSSFHAEVRLKGYPPQRASFRTKNLAKKWIQDTESSIRDGRHFRTAESKKHTLSDLIDRFIKQWLPRNPNGIKKKTALLTWWKNRLGYVLLSDLTPTLIAEARDELLSGMTVRKTIRSSSTVNRYLAALSKALIIAVKEWGWLDDTPMRKLSKPSEGKGRNRLLSIKEKDRLLQACKSSTNPHLYPIVSLALLTGMRFGEIVNLRWKDIDFTNKIITLEKTKNGERRMLPLTEAIETTLLSFRKSNVDFELVFKPRSSTNRCGRVDIRNAFIKALKQAGIEDFRFHDLRHASASYLAMNGATQGELMAILGHRTASMTRRYVVYTQRHMSSLMNKMHTNLLKEDNYE